MTEIIRKKLNDSKAARWSALIIVSFTMMCGYFITDVMAPLEDLLLQSGWTSTEYGFFTGAYGWFNVFLLMLIFGGIILDKMGIRFTGKMSCILMVGGALLKAYAVSSYFTVEGSFWGYNSQVWVAGIGFAFFGMGVEIAGITVSKAIVKWFTGHELALAMGLQVALARIGTACALAFSLPLATYFKEIAAPVLIGALLLCIGTLSFFVYCMMDRKLDASVETEKSGRAVAAEEEEGFKLGDIRMIVTNKGFWLIAFLCVLFYSGVFPFLKFATRLMIYKYGVDPELAGYIPGLLPFGTILLTPLFGSLYDRVGKGATLMLIGSFMLILVHTLFALPILNEWWFATAVMIVLGIAFSLVPSAMWPSVPKIIPQKQLGTAYSLIFYVQNWGLMGVPMIIGWVIDKYAKTTLPDGTLHYDYTVPMCVFTVFGILAVIVALMLKAEDKKKGYGLELPNIKK